MVLNYQRNISKIHVFIDIENLKQKKKKKVKADKLGEIQKETDFALQPSDKISKLDTSQWPLLLKVSCYSLVCLLQDVNCKYNAICTIYLDILNTCFSGHYFFYLIHINIHFLIKKSNMLYMIGNNLQEKLFSFFALGYLQYELLV